MTNNSNNVDLNEVKLKLYEKLKASGWGDKLKTFIMGDEFDKILSHLLKEAQEGRRFTPQIKDIFKAFEKCPYKDLRILFIGDEPSNNIDYSDGLSFSFSKFKISMPLEVMFKTIEKTVYGGSGYSWDKDLTRWAEQGVLLLNSSLTARIGVLNNHGNIWLPFMSFLLDTLKYYNPGLIYVLIGKNAKSLKDFISEDDKIIELYYPSAYDHKYDAWNHNDVFNDISQYLLKNHNEKIIW